MAHALDGAGVKGGVSVDDPEQASLAVMAQSVASMAQHVSRAACQQKSVTIKIAIEDLESLKVRGFSLCFAKKVNGTYNVVWSSSKTYLSFNTFSWTPMYQIFGTNAFVSGGVVQEETNAVDIDLGEKATLDSAGVMHPAVCGGGASCLTLVNQFGPICPGVISAVTTINQRTVIRPIYVAPEPIDQGLAQLTPVESVLVFFDQKLTTSSMFSVASSPSVEINLTCTNSATRLYHDGQWWNPT